MLEFIKNLANYETYIGEDWALSPAAETVLACTVLALAALAANVVVKKVMIAVLFRLASFAARTKEDIRTRYTFIPRLANVVPALVVSAGIATVPHLPETVVTIVQNVTTAFIVVTLALSVSSLLDLAGDHFLRRPDGTFRPIKGYVQIFKIALFSITAILVVAALLDKSPVILLSGLGALAAVLMLVFQDTLLSFVASIQISSSNIVRVGDWIEMPQLNADGDVIDIALYTVQVRNWDNTVTTIPTRRLISDPFKNWRTMFESGGRRIKRSILIDQNSIRFLTDEERTRFHRFALLEEYLDNQEKELNAWNAKVLAQGKEPVNARRPTNIGTFRAYVQNYLRNSERIHQGMTLLVRQLAPSNNGLPLELYCFTNTTAWAQYEGIQSDIFDHLLAIMPEFGLRVFQDPSGADMRALAESTAARG